MPLLTSKTYNFTLAPRNSRLNFKHKDKTFQNVITNYTKFSIFSQKCFTRLLMQISRQQREIKRLQKRDHKKKREIFRLKKKSLTNNLASQSLISVSSINKLNAPKNSVLTELLVNPTDQNLLQQEILFNKHLVKNKTDDPSLSSSSRTCSQSFPPFSSNVDYSTEILVPPQSPFIQDLAKQDWEYQLDFDRALRTNKILVPLDSDSTTSVTFYENNQRCRLVTRTSEAELSRKKMIEKLNDKVGKGYNLFPPAINEPRIISVGHGVLVDSNVNFRWDSSSSEESIPHAVDCSPKCVIGNYDEGYYIQKLNALTPSSPLHNLIPSTAAYILACMDQEETNSKPVEKIDTPQLLKTNLIENPKSKVTKCDFTWISVVPDGSAVDKQELKKRHPVFRWRFKRKKRKYTRKNSHFMIYKRKKLILGFSSRHLRSRKKASQAQKLHKKVSLPSRSLKSLA